MLAVDPRLLPGVRIPVSPRQRGHRVRQGDGLKAALRVAGCLAAGAIAAPEQPPLVERVHARRGARGGRLGRLGGRGGAEPRCRSGRPRRASRHAAATVVRTSGRPRGPRRHLRTRLQRTSPRRSARRLGDVACGYDRRRERAAPLGTEAIVAAVAIAGLGRGKSVLLALFGLVGGVGITALGPGGVLITIGLFALSGLVAGGDRGHGDRPQPGQRAARVRRLRALRAAAPSRHAPPGGRSRRLRGGRHAARRAGQLSHLRPIVRDAAGGVRGDRRGSALPARPFHAGCDGRGAARVCRRSSPWGRSRPPSADSSAWAARCSACRCWWPSAPRC